MNESPRFISEYHQLIISVLLLWAMGATVIASQVLLQAPEPAPPLGEQVINFTDDVRLETCFAGSVAECFGTGTGVFAYTDEFTVYPLTHTGSLLRYGLYASSTDAYYVLTIE